MLRGHHYLIIGITPTALLARQMTVIELFHILGRYIPIRTNYFLRFGDKVEISGGGSLIKIEFGIFN